MSNDNAILLAAAIAIMGLATAGISLYTTRNLRQAFEVWFDSAQRTEVTTVLHSQFGRLAPEIQSNVLKLINVADPLSTLTPSDLDDRVVAWLKGITAQN